MTVGEIVKTIKNGSFQMNEKDLARLIKVSRKDISIDKIIEEINKIKKQQKDEYAILAENFCKTVKVGTTVKFHTSKGISEGIFVGNKEGAKTFHIVLDKIPEGCKTKDRYVKYSKIIIPENYLEENGIKLA